MAERNEQVMQMVMDELRRDPSVALDRLYAQAREIDPSISDLSLRQFNGRYPLQAKRIAAREQQRDDAERPRRGRKQERGGGRRGKSVATRQGGKRTAATRPGAAGGNRLISRKEAIRSVLLGFASEFAQAESRQDIVRVLVGVDTYVTRVETLVAQEGQ